MVKIVISLIGMNVLSSSSASSVAVISFHA